MEIEGYGLTLNLLTEDKIELVRRWRNDPKIQQYMVYRKEITSEQQKAWFKKINNDKNYFFLINYKGEDIGLINLKDINDDYTEGESGVFIYDERFLNNDISYRAHILFFDFIFNELKHKSIRAEILHENKRAIRFTDFLGYRLYEKDEQLGYYRLTKEDYLNNKNRQRFLIREERLNNK